MGILGGIDILNNCSNFIFSLLKKAYLMINVLLSTIIHEKHKLNYFL